MLSREGREKLLDGGALGYFHGILAPAGDLFQPAEEQHLHTRGLGGDGHERIVTRGQSRC